MVTRANEERRAPSLTHARAASICQRALKSLGLRTRRCVDQKDGYDFLVENDVRVAVRYAYPTSYREQHYRKKNGDISRYVYRRWTFNFHRHGKITERYCDFFVCLLGSNQPAGRGTSAVTVFVIPWEAITGLTFCSSVRDDNPRPYRGRYACYIDGWAGLIEKATGQTKPVGGAFTPELRVSLDRRKRLKLAAG